LSKLAILQPSYIPWMGYFEQIIHVDIFVFYDDVQYTKNDWRNRNKIKVHNSSNWLTIPVKAVDNKKINEVIIDNTKNWKVKHLKTIQQFYNKSKYFKEIYPLLENNINSNVDSIALVSINIIKDIANYLELKTKFYLSSELNIEGSRNERLINICKYFKADSYYSGLSAKDYLNIKLFEKNNLKVEFQNFQHPIYSQLHGDFIPYLSIIDLLFNHGKYSKKFIKGNKK